MKNFTTNFYSKEDTAYSTHTQKKPRKTKNFTPNKTFTPNQKNFIGISMEYIHMITSEKTSIFFLMIDVGTFFINRDF